MCNGAVLVVLGSRRWSSVADVARVCRPLAAGFAAVWTTDCWGACAAARRCLPVSHVWAASWRSGRQAGFQRSSAMLAAAPRGSLVVLFVPGGLAELAASPGSAFEARRARSLGLSVLVVGETGAEWLAGTPQLGLFA